MFYNILYQHCIENILALSDQFDKVHPAAAAVLLVLTLALVYSVVCIKKRFGTGITAAGFRAKMRQQKKERKHSGS